MLPSLSSPARFLASHHCHVLGRHLLALELHVVVPGTEVHLPALEVHFSALQDCGIVLSGSPGVSEQVVARLEMLSILPVTSASLSESA